MSTELKTPEYMYRLLILTLITAFITSKTSAQYKELSAEKWLRGFDYREAPKALTITRDEPLGIRGFQESNAIDTLHLFISRDDKKSTNPVRFTVRVEYDDLLRDTFPLKMDTLLTEQDFRLYLKHHKGRRIANLYIDGEYHQNTIVLKRLRYHCRTHVDSWSDTRFYDGVQLFDQANTMQHDVMIIPSPVNSPPHLYNVRSKELYFTANIASPDPAVRKGKAELTVMVIDMGQDYIETFKYEVTGEPQEFRLDMSHQDVQYGYLVLFQPLQGQPAIALRHARLGPMVE